MFLKLQPYVQSSVASRASHKLSFRYYGPYPVLARVNEVAYKLDLPASSQVHPIVHVSLLRKAVLQVLLFLLNFQFIQTFMRFLWQ